MAGVGDREHGPYTQKKICICTKCEYNLRGTWTLKTPSMDPRWSSPTVLTLVEGVIKLETESDLLKVTQPGGGRTGTWTLACFSAPQPTGLLLSAPPVVPFHGLLSPHPPDHQPTRPCCPGRLCIQRVLTSWWRQWFLCEERRAGLALGSLSLCRCPGCGRRQAWHCGTRRAVQCGSGGGHWPGRSWAFQSNQYWSLYYLLKGSFICQAQLPLYQQHRDWSTMGLAVGMLGVGVGRQEKEASWRRDW